jgi:hypothetical protein
MAHAGAARWRARAAPTALAFIGLAGAWAAAGCGGYESCDDSTCGACIYGSFEVRYAPAPAGTAVASIEGLSGTCSRTAEPGLQVCQLSGGRPSPTTVRVTVRLEGHEPGTLDVTFGAPTSFVCCSCPAVTFPPQVSLVPRWLPDADADAAGD